MHPATLRRLLVLGVCAAGVSCLYLVPGVVRAPHPTTGPRPQEPRSTSPSATVVTDVSASTSPRRASAAPSGTTATQTPDPAPEPVRRPPRAAPAPTQASARGGTPFDPTGPQDEVAPAPVAAVTTTAATAERLTLRWPAASDNVGVVSYRVLLDGYEVATTSATSATVRWFNDDADGHVVQVRALDAAGNQSVSSPGLLVERPALSPRPSGTPTTPSGPTPSAPATPVPSPSTSTGQTGEDPDGPADQGEEPPVTPASTPQAPLRPGAR